jgi:hypothetical protein
LDSVGAEAPDAVLVALSDEGNGVAALQKLRASRPYTGLPVFVIAGDDLDERTRLQLAELFAVVVPPDDPVSALEELLGVLFPIEEPTPP